uniref:Uncharacterized protein n=1 Tax=Octopus bimaculoides TaxID=37653 RepID=A0A0L8HPJ5_OCTBM
MQKKKKHRYNSYDVYVCGGVQIWNVSLCAFLYMNANMSMLIFIYTHMDILVRNCREG